ncbi:MAG: T9SS type A sorting domain-containing protein [Bacteroidota bacterium]
MKVLITSLLMALSTSVVCAQHLTPEVVASAGESFETQWVSLDWTLGEIMTETFDGTLILTQGFQQPEDRATSIEAPLADLGDIKVFPNPTRDAFFIEMEHGKSMAISLFDMSGRIVHQQRISESQTEINLSSLSRGIYILRMADGKNAVRSMRIEKM